MDDVEKKGGASPTYPDTAEQHAVPAENFVVGDSLYSKVQRIAGKLSIEQRGIERVPENERNDTSYVNVGTMWLAANLVISTFALGTLGISVFKLGFIDGCLVIIFFNLLSTSTVAFFSSFGAKFGLRQLVLSRFYFGWWGVRMIAFLNILACIGWASINIIIGGQLLHAINYGFPNWAGIVVIAICTGIICMLGYIIVHVYEKWSWVPVFIVYIILIIMFAKSGAFVNVPTLGSGKAKAASVLSFGAAIFGYGTGWTSYSADYTVYQPPTQSRRKIFTWTYLGLNLPLIYTEILGLAVMTGTKSNAAYQAGYDRAGVGGLIGEVLSPLGKFSQFCLVILALSIVANNCPNVYSIGLSAQMLGKWWQGVPRFVWTLIATVCYVAIAIPGASNFEEALHNFMLLIAYWLSIYEAVALSEHFIFRKGMKGYVPEDYDVPEKLPKGIAAITAFFFGAFGAIMGMSQKWFTGPIAKTFGGDIGFELAFVFAGIVYIPLRMWEKKQFGR